MNRKKILAAMFGGAYFLILFLSLASPILLYLDLMLLGAGVISLLWKSGTSTPPLAPTPAPAPYQAEKAIVPEVVKEKEIVEEKMEEQKEGEAEKKIKRPPFLSRYFEYVKKTGNKIPMGEFGKMEKEGKV